MTSLVAADAIEEIVGRPRHQAIHYGIAVSGEKTVYILHSQSCFDHSNDLRACRYSKALDAGIDMSTWGPWQDQPVMLCVISGRLIPINARRNTPSK